MSVVVIGAGLAGLACAGRLHAAGVDVTVVEAADRVGGRVGTDVIDGFRLDRGFQVHNTAYPEAARVLDYDALELRRFDPGALVVAGGQRHLLVDPRRRPRRALATALDDLLSWRDKAAVAALSLRCAALPPSRLAGGRDRTTAAELRAAGVSAEGVERFLRPFLAGVFLEDGLETSARFFRLVWRTFARGDVVVPAAGMAAIPAQLADRLPRGSVRTTSPVAAVTSAGVRLADGSTVGADAVVVATEAAAAARLLALPSAAPATHGVTTFYHCCQEPPLAEPVLVLDGDEPRVVANTVVMSNAAPSYAPDGRALISTSVVGAARDLPGLDRIVADHIARLYDLAPRELDHIATYRIDDALPAMPPPLTLRRPVRCGLRRYVCGDWRDTSSIQGALVSGRRAANAVLADLGGTT